jgi:hypothetical protein
MRAALEEFRVSYGALRHGTPFVRESYALLDLGSASLRNYAYVNTVGYVPLSDYFITRARYLEVALVALVCVVYNLVMTLLFVLVSMIACITYEDAARALYETRTFVLISGISLASLFAGVIGVIAPSWGFQANGAILHVLSENRQHIRNFRGKRP